MIWRAAWLAATLVCLAGGGVAQTIEAVRVTDPTTRYDHAVLGDAVEYGGLQITFLSSSGEGLTRSVKLPASHVFEDIALRPWE
jgi:hypothetical protein